MRSIFLNPVATKLVFAILVKRLGGKVTVRQADIDDVSFNRLEESLETDGALEFELVELRKVA